MKSCAPGKLQTFHVVMLAVVVLLSSTVVVVTEGFSVMVEFSARIDGSVKSSFSSLDSAACVSKSVWFVSLFSVVSSACVEMLSGSPVAGCVFSSKGDSSLGMSISTDTSPLTVSEGVSVLVSEGVLLLTAAVAPPAADCSGIAAGEVNTQTATKKKPTNTDPAMTKFDEVPLSPPALELFGIAMAASSRSASHKLGNNHLPT